MATALSFEEAHVKLLTPREGVERLRVSRSMVCGLCAEGRLAYYRLGAKGRRGRVLIHADDLDRLMSECRNGLHPLLGESPPRP